VGSNPTLSAKSLGVLRYYKNFLENLGYAGKIIDARLNIVFPINVVRT
jgi:hypothetical protein